MLETFLCTSLYCFRFQGKNLASDQHEDQCASQVKESLQFSESPDEITSRVIFGIGEHLRSVRNWRDSMF